MNVLVTGGAGFIGSHIVEHFQGRAEVRALDNLRSGHRHQRVRKMKIKARNDHKLNCHHHPNSRNQFAEVRL